MAGGVNWKLVLLVAIVLPNLSVQGKKHSPKHLQIYAHESHVGPSSTFVVSASPSGNLSGADEFGLLRTVSNILRESSDNESAVIGSQVGIIVVGKDDQDYYLSYTWFFNSNATYQGTIAVQGHIQARNTNETVFALAVVGGTGDFLAVAGEDLAHFDGSIPPPVDVSVHNLTLFCPYW